MNDAKPKRKWWREWIPIAVILGAPTFTAAVSIGMLAAADQFAPGQVPRAFVTAAMLVNAILASVGSAVGGLMLPRLLTGRVVRAVLCLPIGFVWHWIIFYAACVPAGLTA